MTGVAQAYLKFAKANPKFYKIVLNATFAPDCGSLNIIAKDLNNIQFQIVEKMFKSMARIHWNMKGSETRLAWTFIGLINTCIALKKKTALMNL